MTRFRALVAISAAPLTVSAACAVFSAEDGPLTTTPDASGDAASASDGTSTDAAPGPVTELARENGVYGIAVDDTTVYWANPTLQHVRAIAKPGKTTSVPDPVLTDLLEARELQVDSTDLFVGLDSCSPALLRWNKGSKTATPSFANCNFGGAVRIASHSDNVLIGLQVSGVATIFTVSRAGGYSMLGQAPGIVGPVALFGSHAYWRLDNQIQTPDVDGGVFAAASAADLAADAQNLYWVDPNGTVFRSPHAPAGPAPVEVAKDPGTAARMAIFKGVIYWTNESEGRVVMAPAAGGNVTVIASGQAQPFAIAVDDSGVYWTNRGDGTVRMAAFP